MEGATIGMIRRMFAEDGYEEFDSGDGVQENLNGYQIESVGDVALEFTSLNIKNVPAGTITAMVGRSYAKGEIIPGHIRGLEVSAGNARVYRRP